MVAYLIKIEKRGPVPGVARRALNRISKDVWEGIGAIWGEQLRPKHFTDQGAAEYRYQPRQADYEDKKMEEYGHTDPLVYTGESEEATESYRVRSTKDGVKVAMSAPRLNWSKRGHELRRISDQEGRMLARAWASDYEKELKLLQGVRETTKVKG